MSFDVVYLKGFKVLRLIMADGCGDGYYKDRQTGKCKKSITTNPERAGTYGSGFLSENQETEYAKINEVEKKEPPQLVVKQTSAMNSWTSHDEKGTVHQHAHNDLEYAEKIEHQEQKDPRLDPRVDPPVHKSQSKPRTKGGDRMGTCPEGEEFVEGYRKADGTEVDGYCRKKHNNETAEDERKLSENGKKAAGWNDRK